MNEKKHLHEGHRQRLKNKFLEHGFQGFETHNILELLLFYSIPRKDTNEIAHNLLNRFGSLKGVFNASFEELTTVEGIKENSATLIKMIPLIAREYFTDTSKDHSPLDNPEKIGEYLVRKCLGEKNEVVYLLLLNNKFEMISIHKIHEGSVNSTIVSPRKIVEYAVKQNAPMVVLAHNHPEGTVCPSMDDIETTARLMSSLKNIDIKLLEHFVVAGSEYCPIINYTSSLKSINSENRQFFKRS